MISRKRRCWGTVGFADKKLRTGPGVVCSRRKRRSPPTPPFDLRKAQGGAAPGTVSFVFVAAAPGSDKKLPALTSFAPAAGGGSGAIPPPPSLDLHKARRPRPTGTTRAFHPLPFPSAKACITADASPTMIRSNAVPFKIPENASLRLQCALRRSSAPPTPSDGPMLSSSSSALQRTLGLLVLAYCGPSNSLKRAGALTGS